MKESFSRAVVYSAFYIFLIGCVLHFMRSAALLLTQVNPAVDWVGGVIALGMLWFILTGVMWLSDIGD